jgi:ribonuclease-3
MKSTFRKRNLNELSEKLGYTFKKPEIIIQAFRHSSYVNEQTGFHLKDNERLEFLGDAVLDLAISHILMELFQYSKEGDLSKYRATVVNEKGLCQVAQGLALGDHLTLGKGEEMMGGRKRPSILADTMEAVLGALYLDAGFEKTKEIIQRLFLPLLEEIKTEKTVSDYKSQLQEYTQETYKTRPEYVMVGESGPPHDKTFRVAINLQGQTMAEDEGKSKKEAEQNAAKKAFECLKKEQKKDL